VRFFGSVCPVKALIAGTTAVATRNTGSTKFRLRSAVFVSKSASKVTDAVARVVSSGSAGGA
jgi:hypothetical protein